MLASDHVQGGARWGRGWVGRYLEPQFLSPIFEGLWGTPQNKGLFQPKQRYFWVVEKLQNMFSFLPPKNWGNDPIHFVNGLKPPTRFIYIYVYRCVCMYIYIICTYIYCIHLKNPHVPFF